MDSLTRFSRKITEPFLRVSLALVLLWIGGLKFVDPSPVVGLLEASLPFFASEGFVYVLGVLEVSAAGLLLAGVAVRWVSAGLVGLFAGTLFIFVVAPAVSYGENGFPLLTLAGEFLLKDLVLMAASVAVLGLTADELEAGSSVSRRKKTRAVS